MRPKPPLSRTSNDPPPSNGGGNAKIWGCCNNQPASEEGSGIRVAKGLRVHLQIEAAADDETKKNPFLDVRRSLSVEWRRKIVAIINQQARRARARRRRRVRLSTADSRPPLVGVKRGNAGAPAESRPKKKEQFVCCWCNHALRVWGRKQGQCRPRLGGRDGRHLHDFPGRAQKPGRW
jgi:hypothetical protein